MLYSMIKFKRNNLKNKMILICCKTIPKFYLFFCKCRNIFFYFFEIRLAFANKMYVKLIKKIVTTINSALITVCIFCQILTFNNESNKITLIQQNTSQLTYKHWNIFRIKIYWKMKQKYYFVRITEKGKKKKELYLLQNVACCWKCSGV